MGLSTHGITYHFPDVTTDSVGLVLSGHTSCGLIHKGEVYLYRSVVFSSNDPVACRAKT